MATTRRSRINERAWRDLRESLALGLHAAGLVIESQAKRDAPVRGGRRSFMTGPKTKAGKPKIGGTLRRSIHTVTYLDGERRAAGLRGTDVADENKAPLPDYVPGRGIRTIVGTNSGYGYWVDQGTIKMAARPFLSTAPDAARGPAVAAFHRTARAEFARRTGRG